MIINRILLCLAIVLSSCSPSRFDTPVDQPNLRGVIRIQTNYTGFIKPTTRVSDNAIGQGGAWAYVFRQTKTDVEPKLVFFEEVTIRDNGSGGGETDINYYDNISDADTKYKIVLLVNAPAKFYNGNTIKNFADFNPGLVDTYSQLKEKLNTVALAEAIDPQDAIPMSGTTNEFTMDDLASGSAAISVNLKRIVAKIAVTVAEQESEFSLLGASVCNAPAHGYFLEPSSVAKMRNNSASLINYTYPLAVAANNTTASTPIYIYESRYAEQTAIIFHGVYQGAEYFYKFRMPQSCTDGNFLRNHYYNFIIESVKSIGYSTYEEAVAGAYSNNIVLRIDVTDLTSHDIIDNGEYFLGLSNSEFWYYADNLTTMDLSITRISHNAPQDAVLSFKATGGIVVTNPFTHGFDGTVMNEELLVKIPENFTAGEVEITLGNLKKTIKIVRKGNFISATAEGSSGFIKLTDYLDNNFVVASVADKNVDWVSFSDDAALNLNEATSNTGGFNVTILNNNSATLDALGGYGSNMRTAILYFSRRNSQGRLRVMITQNGTEYIAPQTRGVGIMNPYVGAFWRNQQVGERVIDMGNTSGEWLAQVTAGDDFIRLTKNFPLNWDISNSAEDYPINDGSVGLSGTGKVLFRIGMTSTNPHPQKPRYGVVMVRYRKTPADNFENYPVFIRQGEEADYLMRPVDPISSEKYTNTRPCAVRFMPYNLKDPKNNNSSDFLTTSIMTKRVQDPDYNPNKVVDFPTKAGSQFHYRYQLRAVMSTHPTLVNYPVTTPMASNWVELEDEICPKGYRRPNDGPVRDADFIFDNVTPDGSEIRQSLWEKPSDGNVYANTAKGKEDAGCNSLFGYYADGYFDRLIISGETSVGVDYGIAHQGILFFNRFTNSSLFFPAAGRRRHETNGLLESKGTGGTYLTTTLTNASAGGRKMIKNIYGNESFTLTFGNTATYLTGSGTGNTNYDANVTPCMISWNKNRMGSIRCVKDE